MNRVLLLIPNEFNCFPKFERKVGRITQSLTNFSVVFTKDNNGLIAEYFKRESKVEVLPVEDWRAEEVTHAIVFDDGEEFHEEIVELKEKNIPTRVIKIKITRVVNIKKETHFQGLKSTPDFEYIGRGSYWGNPHSMYEDGDDRDEVIRKYRYDFEYDKFLNIDKSRVYELAGKKLGCFCKPAPCHGDVLAEFLNSWDDGA